MSVEPWQFHFADQMGEKMKSSVESPPMYDDVPFRDAPASKFFIGEKMEYRKKRGCCTCIATVLLLTSFVCFGIGSYLVFNSYEKRLSEEHTLLTKLMNVVGTERGSVQQQALLDIHLIKNDDQRAAGTVSQGDKCSVVTPDKIDCYPGGGASKDRCEAKGLCFVAFI